MGVIALADFQTEATKRGNGDILDAPFNCPMCGHVATPRQFLELGDDPNLAPQECIGRAMNRHGAKPGEVGEWGKPGSSGCCNWAAYGLLAAGDTYEVEFPNGNRHRVFPFADAASADPVMETSNAAK